MGLLNWQVFSDMGVKELIRNREEAWRDMNIINWIIRKKNFEEDISEKEAKMLSDYENGRIDKLDYQVS